MQPLLFNITISQYDSYQILQEAMATNRSIKDCVAEVVRLFVGYCVEESVDVDINLIVADKKPASIDEQVLEQLESKLGINRERLP